MTGTDSALAQEQQNPPGTEETGCPTEVETPGDDTDEPAEEAEEAPRPTGLTEQVKVTATRVETDLMKTPIAVTVIDQDMLDREGVQDIRNMARLVPNMWSMLHAGIRMYRGNGSVEVLGYNLTNDVVRFWGGAAENVAKGSFSVPRKYGFQVGRKFTF